MDESQATEGEKCPQSEVKSLREQLVRARRKCKPHERRWLSALHRYGNSPYRTAEALRMSKATVWRYLQKEHIQAVLDLMEKVDLARDASDRMLVKERYRGLIDSNMKDFFNADGRLKAPHEWTAEQGALVKKYGFDRFGPYIELYDAKGATDSYAKILRMMSDRVELSGPYGGPVETTNRVSLESKITPENADRDYLEVIKRTKTG